MRLKYNLGVLSKILVALTVLSSLDAMAGIIVPTATDASACQRRNVRNEDCGHWSRFTLKIDPNAWKYDVSQIPNTVPHQTRWYGVTVTRVVVLEGIEFDFDKYNIRASSFPIMERNVADLKSERTLRVRIVGHTDAIGSDAYNNELSEQRAAAAKDFFIAHGVDSSRLTSEGRGESQPVAPNQNRDGSDNPEGRAHNRRIELHITSKGQ